MKVKSESEVAQSCLTLSDPMDCSPPGSSIHGIFQARVLEWGAIAFSKGLHYNVANAESKNLSFGGEREDGFTQGAHREGRASPSDVRFVIYPNV